MMPVIGTLGPGRPWRRRSLVVAVGVSGVVTAASLGVVPVASAAVLAPIAAGEDAYVQSDQPTTNFGTVTTLNNVSGTPEARAYLKFTVTGVTGTITKATFRAFAQTSSGTGYELHQVADNSWTESGLTS